MNRIFEAIQNQRTIIPTIKEFKEIFHKIHPAYRETFGMVKEVMRDIKYGWEFMFWVDDEGYIRYER